MADTKTRWQDLRVFGPSGLAYGPLGDALAEPQLRDRLRQVSVNPASGEQRSDGSLTLAKPGADWRDAEPLTDVDWLGCSAIRGFEA